MFNLKLGLTNIFLGLLLIIVCVPLAKRRVKMNRWYGMRLSKAFMSEENWYKINEYGGKQFIVWSALMVLGGVATLLLPQFGVDGALYAGLLPAVLLLVPLIKLFIYAGKI